MPGRTRFFLFALLPLTAPLSAQVDNSGLLPYMPEAVQRIRKEQGVAAAAADIQVIFNDVGMSSTTGLRGVPSRFRDLVIESEGDLIGRIEELYPLLGFRGTETLRFSQKYQPPPWGQPPRTDYIFREYIDGIQTAATVVVEVDDATKGITRIKGSAVLDRGFPRASIVSESDAIKCGLNYVQEKGVSQFYKLDGKHRAEKVLDAEGSALEPWWYVYMESESDRTDLLFIVGPYEKVFLGTRNVHGPDKQIGYCVSKTGEWVPLPTGQSVSP